MCLISFKPQFYELLTGKNTLKSALGRVSYVNVCKLAQIAKKKKKKKKKRQVVLLVFDIKLKQHFIPS